MLLAGWQRTPLGGLRCVASSCPFSRQCWFTVFHFWEPQHKRTENTRAGSFSCKNTWTQTHTLLYVHTRSDAMCSHPLNAAHKHAHTHTHPEPVCYDSEGSSWSEGSSGGGGELSPSGGLHICLPPQLAAEISSQQPGGSTCFSMSSGFYTYFCTVSMDTVSQTVVTPSRLLQSQANSVTVSFPSGQSSA